MILPRYTLERIYLPTSTPGSIFPGSVRVESTIIAKTLELPWRNNAISSDPKFASCIKEGIYVFVWQPPRHDRPYEYFRCLHVPGRHWYPDTKMSSILIHTGNYTDHLLGCIAPGSRHADINTDGVVDVVDSTKKLLWMTKNMPKAFELEIREKK
jgi:hypothetical protein